MTAEPAATPPSDRKRETLVFLVTCFVIIPGFAVAFTGAYGLAIWLSQLYFGPPGPPA